MASYPNQNRTIIHRLLSTKNVSIPSVCPCFCWLCRTRVCFCVSPLIRTSAHYQMRLLHSFIRLFVHMPSTHSIQYSRTTDQANVQREQTNERTERMKKERMKEKKNTHNIQKRMMKKPYPEQSNSICTQRAKLMPCILFGMYEPFLTMLFYITLAYV